MPLDPRDHASILDMAEAARDILELTRDLPLSDYQRSKERRRAIERLFEVMGEAARRISPDTMAVYSAVPWREIIGFRNKISHDYDNIDPARVWRVATEDIPPLVLTLEALVDTLGKDGQSS